MKTFAIMCNYQTAETPRGRQKLSPSKFLVELCIDDKGEVLSWLVDDRTACFYTDLTSYNHRIIQFEGSEINGQTGSLLIKRVQREFIQKSDVNGEWLILKGTCEEIDK